VAEIATKPSINDSEAFAGWLHRDRAMPAADLQHLHDMPLSHRYRQGIVLSCYLVDDSLLLASANIITAK